MNKLNTGMKLNQTLKTTNKQKTRIRYGFTSEVYQTSRGKLTPILLKLLPKNPEEGLLLSLLSETNITLIPKAYPKKRKLGTSITDDTHWKRPWCWERLKARREGDDRGWELDGITNAMDMSLSRLRVGDGQGSLACCSPSMGSQSWTQLSDWTELIIDEHRRKNPQQNTHKPNPTIY